MNPIRFGAKYARFVNKNAPQTPPSESDRQWLRHEVKEQGYACFLASGTGASENKWLLLNPTEADEFRRTRDAEDAPFIETIKADIEKGGLDTVTLEYEIKNVLRRDCSGKEDRPVLETRLNELNV